MAVAHDVLIVFRNALLEIYQSIFGGVGQKSGKFSRAVTVIALVVGIGYGGFRIYRWRIESREAQAQVVFSESMRLYHQAKASLEKWDDVVGAFALGYEQHRSSSLAPFFQLFQAQAMERQGKSAEAVRLTRTALETLKPTNPLYGFYQTKLALMQLDSADATVSEVGLKELKMCGLDESNRARDMALFYLGLHYWDNDDIENAGETWEKLKSLKVQEGKEVSPFVALAEQKIKQLG